MCSSRSWAGQALSHRQISHKVLPLLIESPQCNAMLQEHDFGFDLLYDSIGAKMAFHEHGWPHMVSIDLIDCTGDLLLVFGYLMLRGTFRMCIGACIIQTCPCALTSAHPDGWQHHSFVTCSHSHMTHTCTATCMSGTSAHGSTA